jgi:restriction endonuclease S subunit
MFIIKECSEHIKYIYYILNYITDLSQLAHGITIKGITKDDLLNIKIPIPIIEIQEQIIKECDYYDKQIETLKKENELLIKQNDNIINSFLQSI